MLTSIGQDDLTEAATMYASSNTDIPHTMLNQTSIPEDTSLSFAADTNNKIHEASDIFESSRMMATNVTSISENDAERVIEQVGHERPSTVPGDFRSTIDPFGSTGRYGSILTNQQP
jgi:hypothetical protein